MQQLIQALDYRLALLKAAHELEWRLQKEHREDVQRVLTEAAREALLYIAQPSLDQSKG